jgi:hypothetical protein
LNGTLFHIVLFFKWLIPQCLVNSITSRIQTMNVCSFLVLHHFQTTRSMELSIGMNRHRTDKSHTRVVRGVLIGLIVAHPIVVLDSALKGSGSGSSCYYCRLDSQGWWLSTITSVGVDWQEGAFFFVVRYSRSNPFPHQNNSTTRRSQQTSLRRRNWGYCYSGFSSLVHCRDYWNYLSLGRI